MRVLVEVPTTTGCGHVVIKTLDGVPIAHYSVTEIRAPVADDDPFDLLRLLKYIIKKSGATTRAQARTVIQGEDF